MSYVQQGGYMTMEAPMTTYAQAAPVTTYAAPIGGSVVMPQTTYAQPTYTTSYAAAPAATTYTTMAAPTTYTTMAAPAAAAAVDVNADGRADYIVAGSDFNRDGIPDAIEQPAVQYTTMAPMTSYVQ